MLESALEHIIYRYSRACGGKAYKFISPGNPGVPDRLCVFPDGRVIFVELKRPGRENGLNPQQRKTISFLRGLGCCAWVINSADDFKRRLHDLGIHP